MVITTTPPPILEDVSAEPQDFREGEIGRLSSHGDTFSGGNSRGSQDAMASSIPEENPLERTAHSAGVDVDERYDQFAKWEYIIGKLVTLNTIRYYSIIIMMITHFDRKYFTFIITYLDRES